MSSIFTKIVKREIPAYVIAEDDFHIAFLDVNPLKYGHTLVIPKKEIDYIFDIENHELEQLIIFAKKVAIQIKCKIECKKIGMTVIGLEVPHAHIHLIPINSVDDMNFNREKLKLDTDQLSNLQQLLVS